MPRPGRPLFVSVHQFPDKPVQSAGELAFQREREHPHDRIAQQPERSRCQHCPDECVNFLEMSALGIDRETSLALVGSCIFWPGDSIYGGKIPTLMLGLRDAGRRLFEVPTREMP